MGFINSATTINIKGKLTPNGRQRLANGASSLITNFIAKVIDLTTIADSDIITMTTIFLVFSSFSCYSIQ